MAGSFESSESPRCPLLQPVARRTCGAYHTENTCTQYTAFPADIRHYAAAGNQEQEDGILESHLLSWRWYNTLSRIGDQHANSLSLDSRHKYRQTNHESDCVWYTRNLKPLGLFRRLAPTETIDGENAYHQVTGKVERDCHMPTYCLLDSSL